MNKTVRIAKCRLDDVPSLRSHAEILHGLGVNDVRIAPLRAPKHRGYVAVIYFSVDQSFWSAVRWVLPPQPTKREASEAAATFLRAMIDALCSINTWNVPDVDEAELDRMVDIAAGRAEHGHQLWLDMKWRELTDGRRTRSGPRNRVLSDDDVREQFDPEDYQRWRSELTVRRKAAGDSQRTLAEQVGVTQGTISHIERGKNDLPSRALVRRISAVYDIDDPAPSENVLEVRA